MAYSSDLKKYIISNFIEDLLPTGISSLEATEYIANIAYQIFKEKLEKKGKRFIPNLPKIYPEDNPRLQNLPYAKAAGYNYKDKEIEMRIRGANVGVPSFELSIEFEYVLTNRKTMKIKYIDAAELVVGNNLNRKNPEKEEYFGGTELRPYPKYGFVRILYNFRSVIEESEVKNAIIKFDVSDRPNKILKEECALKLNFKPEDPERKYIQYICKEREELSLPSIHFKLKKFDSDQKFLILNVRYTYLICNYNEKHERVGGRGFTQEETRFESINVFFDKEKTIRDFIFTWLKSDDNSPESLYTQLVSLSKE